jgi:iron complex transport system substrate-binding protein
LATTPAGKAKRLIKMDGAFLLGFGPRTAGAVKELAVELYGNEITN